jgi:hypothetical protein
MTLERRDSCRCQEHVQRRKNLIGSLASVSDETSLIHVDGEQGWRLSRLCCLVSQLIASSDRHPRLPIHGHLQPTPTIHTPYIRRTLLQEPEIASLPHTHALRKLQLRSCSNQHASYSDALARQAHHAVS